VRHPRRLTVRLALLAIVAGIPAGAASTGDAIEVTASRQGFRPATLAVRAGETLRLLLKTADDEHCFAVDELRVEKRIMPGRTTRVDLAPDAVGRLRFYCCLKGPDSVERGTLVVSE
jgi:heme/copper-type cytochrome/quinol oxidase subunit 2